MARKILTVNDKLLRKALDFAKSLETNGIVKNYPLYIATLDEYASHYGFTDFDSMIMELAND